MSIIDPLQFSAEGKIVDLRQKFRIYLHCCKYSTTSEEEVVDSAINLQWKEEEGTGSLMHRTLIRENLSGEKSGLGSSLCWRRIVLGSIRIVLLLILVAEGEENS